MESMRQLADIQISEANASGNSQLHIGNNINNYAAQQSPAPVPAFSTVPFLRDQTFVPRGTILDDVERMLSAPAGRCALCGLGGAGKSQLAIEYSFQERDRSPDKWVFWVYASNAQRLQVSVRNNLKRLNIQGLDEPGVDVLEILQRWLQDVRNGRWLLVLDNVDHVGILETTPEAGDVGTTHDPESSSGVQLLENLSTCSHGSILVTTRSKMVATKVVEFERSIIDVKQMHNVESILLIKTKLGDKCSDAEATGLANALDHLPLAMAQAAAYIKRRGHRCTVRQYLETLDKSDEAMRKELQRDEADPRRHKEGRNSILLTWQISFEHIRETRPSAADLLSLMSFFDRQTIPEALLKDRTFSFDGNVPGVGITRTTHPDSNPDNTYRSREVSSAHSGSDDSDSSSSDGSSVAEKAFERDLDALIDYSFISITIDPAMFEMHRLVQVSTQAWLMLNKAFDRWASQFVVNLSGAFPNGDFETWAVCRQLLPHAVLALETKLGNRAPLIQQSILLHDAGWFASEQGDYTLAVTFKMASLELRKGLYSEEHEETLTSMNNLAITYSRQGRRKEAEELNIKVLETRRRVLGEEHVDTLTSMNNLALTCSHQGRWKEAEDLEVNVVEARRRVLGEEHVETLTSMNNLALTYWYQGRWKEAEKLWVKVLEARQRVLGEEHPDTLQAMSNLASTYSDQGRWKEAEELQLNVLEARRRVLGEEHVDTLTSINNLASTYRDQGRLKEAEELLVKVLEARRRVLGEEHADTLRSMHNLASTYRDQGRSKEAEELLVKVLEARRRVLGTEHPDTLESASNLAWTLRDLEQHDAAVDLMELAADFSAKVLGDEHPETIKRFEDLAYMAKQDLERSTVQGSGLWSRSNEEDDAVAGATEDDGVAAPERSGGADVIAAEQNRVPEVCLLDPATIALVQSMGITRISGLSGSASPTQRSEE
ncbi:hypothetical protein B0A48_15365 [Cryoendolithus antarcticus]|uniref:Uncharacterized protein n=1 Tax=Cryoendolithus antarcticus TaxID=1507870 RepID=A0A1V8SHZ3_9PEZI|nr:hypothetical protein B0A48_15365 [Cryoendolithus antarcticus]